MLVLPGYVPGFAYFKEVIVGATPVTVALPEGRKASALSIAVGSEDHPATSSVFFSYDGTDPVLPVGDAVSAYDYITANHNGDRYFGVSEVRMVSAEEGQYVRLLFSV